MVERLEPAPGAQAEPWTAVNRFVMADPVLREWYVSADTALEDPRGTRFLAAYATVVRRLGPEGTEPLPPPFVHARPHWTRVDWARLALVLRGFESLLASEHVELVERLFQRGEIGEQESVLRTLSLLPEPERFVRVAISACRTNAVSVFEAIACENPYPERYFPELNFNQMVLKAVFMSADTGRIEQLRRRITPELRRMANDLASERRAAGREIPRDLELIVQADSA